jgi:hypothetical protein
MAKEHEVMTNRQALAHLKDGNPLVRRLARNLLDAREENGNLARDTEMMSADLEELRNHRNEVRLTVALVMSERDELRALLRSAHEANMSETGPHYNAQGEDGWHEDPSRHPECEECRALAKAPPPQKKSTPHEDPQP